MLICSSKGNSFKNLVQNYFIQRQKKQGIYGHLEHIINSGISKRFSER